MESKRLIVLCAIIIICAAGICGAAFITQTSQKDTEITVMSNSSIYCGENVTAKLTANGTPLANQTVNMSIASSDGKKITVNTVTDENGTASYELNDTEVGNYTLEWTYGGNEEYRDCNSTTKLEITEKPVEVESQSTNYNNQKTNSDYEVDEDRKTTEECLFTYEEGSSKWGLSKEEVDFHNSVIISRYEEQTGKKF